MKTFELNVQDNKGSLNKNMKLSTGVVVALYPTVSKLRAASERSIVPYLKVSVVVNLQGCGDSKDVGFLVGVVFSLAIDRRTLSVFGAASL